LRLEWLNRATTRLPFGLLLSIRSQLTDRFVVSGLTILAVASSVALTMSVEVASRGLQEALSTTTRALTGTAGLTVSAGEVGVREELADQIDSVSGVVGTSPLIRRTFRLASGKDAGRSLHVIGLDLLSENDVRRYEVSREGVVVRDAVRLLALPDSIIVAETFAAEMEIGDGDTLELTLDGRRVDLIVRGVLGGELAEAFGGQIAAMDIYALQQVASMEGRFDRIDVALRPGQVADEVAASIKAVIGPAYSVGQDVEQQGFALALLRTYQRALWAFVVLALATSALLTYAVSSMSIDRRLEELSLLRAAGMEGARVGRALFVDTLVVAVAGTAIGACIAPFVTRATVSVLSVASAVLANVDLSRMDSAPSTFVLGIAVGVAGILAAAIPAARRAARIGPLDLVELGRGSLRLGRTARLAAGLAATGGALLCLAWVNRLLPEETGVVAAIIGGIALSAGLGHRLTDRGAQPDGWLGRVVPRIGFLIGPSLRDRAMETSLTMAAWATISASLFTGLTAVSSYTGNIDNYYYRLYGEEAVLVIGGDPFASRQLDPIPFETINALRATGKVADLAKLRGVEIPFGGEEVLLTVFDADPISRRGDLSFVSENPEETLHALQHGDLAINESLARRFGLTVGGTVTIPTELGARSFRIGSVIRGLAGPNGGLHLSEQAFESAFPNSENACWLAALWLTSPDTEAIAELRRVPTSVPLFFLQGKEARRWVAHSAEKYRGLLSVPVSLVCGLGVISLLSLLFGATRSRQREFGLLRAAGATRGDIVAVVTVSGVLVGTLGALTGILIGVVWSEVTCRFLSDSMGLQIAPLGRVGIAAWVSIGAVAISAAGSLLPAVLSTRTASLASQAP
jgi:putative ABC transport system permease protein